MSRSAETESTVFVVDDEPDVRDSISLLLKSVGHAVASFASADEFFEGCYPDRPGCLVLDVRLPGMSGLRMQQALGERGFRLPVIFISGHGDIPMAVRAVQAGALDFLEKPFGDQALIDCVDRALALDAGNRQAEAERAEVADGLSALTPREYEVLLKLLDGKVNKIVARELDLSTRTVEIHRARVLQKMGVTNAQQLVRRVMASGLVDLPEGADEAVSPASAGS